MTEGIIFVTIAMGIIGFSKRNFTMNTLKKSVELWIIYMFLGVFSFICGLNGYLGLIINFIIIFIIVYVFVSEYEEQVYYPLVMYYIYMQVNPIRLGELPIRLLLTSIGVFIMVTIIYSIQKRKQSPFNDIILLINNILEGNKIEEILSTIAKKIYRRRSENYYISTEDRKLLNIVFALERLSKKINDKNKININGELNLIKEYINGYRKEIENIDELQDRYKIYNFIIKNVKELKNLEDKQRKEYKYNWSKIDLFSIKNIFKRNFNKNSFKFRFAAKMALSLSILKFITDSVMSTQLKFSWVMITVMVLVQPYAEDTFSKGINRLKGALIGCLAFGVLFNVFESNIIREIILMIALFLYIKVKEDYKKQIFMTFITVGAAAFTIDLSTLISRRILYIFIGIVISYLITLILFPYKREMGEHELKNKVKANMDLIQEEKLKLKAGEENLEALRNLVLNSIMIGNKLGGKSQEEILNKCCEISDDFLKKYIE